ncbi:uncharacterized protein [Aegilops tauschii subsp. strangulata]|uniref:uncharacterized protein n=1 Tax=Aegilops tauschii subsp. strangulata TaxID=200361 RepID=UPI001ABC7FB4|nr:uncharacterized protein LOC109754571 [Aegilops tauschii subsp. strangulata]
MTIGCFDPTIPSVTRSAAASTFQRLSVTVPEKAGQAAAQRIRMAMLCKSLKICSEGSTEGAGLVVQTAFTCALPRRNAAGKAQAAREVCAASCPHRRRSPRRAHFVDWYLVLAIGEASSEDAINRRYRHLAPRTCPKDTLPFPPPSGSNMIEESDTKRR